MNVLAIETSTDRASVALRINGKDYQVEQLGFRDHAKVLLSLIEGLFRESNSTREALQAIAFGCGPGSFTGLRVAASVAKALAYAADLPVYPVNSLWMIAEAVYATSPGNVDILAVLDARMNEVYWAEVSQAALIQAPSVASAESLILLGHNPLILAGVGLEAYVPQLPEAIQARVIEQRTVYPTGLAMIRLIEQGLIQTVSAAEARPFYIRNQVIQGENRG